MRIIMWATLSVLVAYEGDAEMATIAMVLLTIAYFADDDARGRWHRDPNGEQARSATSACVALRGLRFVAGPVVAC
jgi:hypothetical protein